MGLIPEGMCLALPLYILNPNDPKKALLIALLAGLSEPIGAILAYSSFSNEKPDSIASKLSLAIVSSLGKKLKLKYIAAGLTCTIAFRSVLSHAKQYDKHDKVTTYSVLVGACLLFLGNCLSY